MCLLVCVCVCVCVCVYIYLLSDVVQKEVQSVDSVVSVQPVQYIDT